LAVDTSLLDQSGWPDVPFDTWTRAALKAARVEALDRLRSDFEGLPIEPLYAPAAGCMPIRMRRPGWAAFQRVDDPDVARAAAQATTDAGGGADGLALVFEGAANAFGRGLPATEDALRAVLSGIELEKTALRIDAHPAIRRSADWLVALFEERKPDLRKVRLAIGIDTANIFAATGRLGMTLEALSASLPQSMSGFFAAGLPGILLEGDSRVIHNAGGTAAQELGHALAVGVQHLRLFNEARQPLIYGAPIVGFALALDQDFFAGIAKLRAMRLLWRRAQELCGIETPVETRIHVETSFRMASAIDAETNILRNVIALSAAAIGGADTVSVLPHSIALGLPDAQARRLACMMQLIARDEAHLGLVTDAAAGSGAIQALTDALCAAAWAEFQQIEREGGPLRSLAAGHVQSRVREAAAARANAGGSMIGVTIHPQRQPRAIATVPHPEVNTRFPEAITCERLTPWSIDSLAEKRPADGDAT
jgi:methylmalonyl-CoA mutase